MRIQAPESTQSESAGPRRVPLIPPELHLDPFPPSRTSGTGKTHQSANGCSGSEVAGEGCPDSTSEGMPRPVARIDCLAANRRVLRRGVVGSTEATMDSEKQPSLWPTNVPWNNGRLTGQKRPLKPKDVWAIRVRLQMEHRERDLALFSTTRRCRRRAASPCRIREAAPLHLRAPGGSSANSR